MELWQKQRLEEGGVQVEEGLARMMGSEALLLKFLGKFPGQEAFPRLEEALAKEDWEGAVAASHSLKGIAGNLSLGALYRLFTRQVELLRAGQNQEALALMEEIRPAHRQAVEAIREVCGG